MQSEEYRKALLYGIRLMYNTMLSLFQYGMDIACLEELKEIILDGEQVELQPDILDTMDDLLVRKIGEVVVFTSSTIETILNINGITDEQLIVNQEENAAIFEENKKEQQRKDIIKLIKDYLESESFQMPFLVIDTLATMNGYDTAKYNVFGDSLPFYITCDDKNIQLFASFSRQVDELYNYIIENELA